MAKFINGEITSINEGIVDDIEVLVEVVLYERRPDPITRDAAQRVETYLATYKLEESHGE